MILATGNQNEIINNFMDKKNTIKRVLFIDDISMIDFDNIGCHWTSNMSYAHAGGGMNGFSKGKFQVTLLTSRTGINKEATKISREGYPHEKEIVLNENTALKVVYLLVVPMINGKLDYSKQERFIISGNTGNRVDKWVKIYKNNDNK